MRGLDGLLDETQASGKWEVLLPLAAGTGYEWEEERLSHILDWMWRKVLRSLQPIAEMQEIWSADPEGECGRLWRRMCQRKDRDSATDVAAYASVVGGVEGHELRQYYRAAALAVAYAASGAGIVVVAASEGKLADAASVAGHVASEAANAHGAVAGIQAAGSAAEGSARGLYAATDNLAHMTPSESLRLSRRVIGEACAKAYAAAFPVGRTKFWNTVKPKELLLKLTAPELVALPIGRPWWWPWG